ncbi:MAG TPA: hypothetical protein VII72_21845 [Myxococcota bacterium]|jgi:hypothetical protein
MGAMRTRKKATARKASKTKRRSRPKGKAKPKRKAGAHAAAARGSYAALAAAALDPGLGVRQRIRALADLSGEICDDTGTFHGVLDILRDAKSPSGLRLAALQALQAATFSAVKFSRSRPEYLTALRAVAADPDLELRQRVLGLLARERDGSTQQKLLDGLKNPAKALVPPEKALQLLGYDVHADAYPVARRIVRDPPNPAAKREALRLLAADAASAPVFEEILRNKAEPAEFRQLSVSVLHSLAPRSLQAHAREMVLDDTEDDDLRAAGLTALTQFGEQGAITADAALVQRVDRLKGGKGSAMVKKGARRFLDKYRP